MSFKLVLLAILAISISCKNIPTINLYFESLCPGCEGFIGESFKAFYNTEGHENIATVNFFPYGNAHETQSGSKWAFTCQHGAPECQGNLIETCAMAKQSTEVFQGFLVCIKEHISKYSNNFIETAKHCEPNQETYNSIIECYQSDEGNKLQHDVALATESLNPPHKWVPWITVDGKYDSKVQDVISDDMVGWICKNYSDIPAVKKVCDSRKSTVSSTNKEVCLKNSLKFLEQ
jgi:interferon gamma-inducible protein 30